jgi:hypothetical protein
VSLLETIAKQGRAYGIHLVLASQTVSGISGLRSKGQSIFAQFPLRISLKNTPDESQAVLAAHNTAAAELSHRGEVIVNRNFGHVASNERGLAAYVDSARFARLQRELWQRGHGRAPLVFMGREPAAWDEQALDALRPPTDREAPLQLWVGRPIQITDEPERIAIRRDVDQAVAIVGADHESDPVMPGLVGSMIVSAAGQLQAGDVVVVLDGTGERAPEWLAPVEDRLRRLGVSLRHVPASGAAAVLRDELGRRPRDGFDTVLVVALAVQRIPGMDETAPSSDAAPDPLGGFGALSLGGSLAGASGDAAPTTARAALQLLAREGALRGTPLIASWANVAALNASLGLSHAGVGSYLTVSLGREDLKVVANTHDPRIAGHPRVGYVDRNSTRGLRTVVPFARWGGARRHGEAE